jgi:hypothetical protein
MDMVVGAEYYSKRGWAPNGDFRYKGPGLDHLTARWNALLDRGVEEEVGNSRPADRPGPVGYELVNQGGVDVSLLGREDLSPATRVAGGVEYLSSYVYRLVFDDNYSQAISSEVSSEVVDAQSQRQDSDSLAGPLSILRQHHQRQRGEDSAPAAAALRCAGPAAGKLTSLLGTGIVAQAI